MSNPNEGKPVLSAPAATESLQQVRRIGDAAPTGFIPNLKYNLQFVRGRGSLEISIVLVVLVLGYVIAGIVVPNDFPFLDANNLSGVISQAVPVLAILGIGAGILMVADEFDLSLGASLTFNAIVFIQVDANLGLVPAIIAAIISGALIALINGAIVVFTKIPSFIATLGMSFFWAGASIWINGTQAAMIDPEHYNGAMELLFVHDFGIFRSQFLWMLLVGILAWFFLHRHRLGNHIYAVGGNTAAAEAISINPRKVKLMSFAIYGSLVGLASIMIAVRTTSMQAGGNATQDFTLFAIAAAVVGGTSLQGGRGSIIGMVAGAALIELIKNGLILGKAPYFYITVFVGVTIVIASIFNKLMEGKAR
ncbi:MAG: Ribose transport system permease protein RbsC [Actinomycetota bacterium]|jgi:simple sugar transport system permease protein